MEILLVLGLVGFVLLAPIFAVIAFARTSRAERELREAVERLASLESRVEALAKRLVSARAEERAPEAPPVPAREPEPAPLPVAAPAPVVTPIPPPRAVVTPQPPPRPPRPEPAPAPEPRFDWESLVGLKGAAWLGGIALVIASLFFAKWTVDQGLVTPPLRIAGLVLAGVAALVWAELSLRRGYATTANAVSGAGIAILYIAFYAGHALYGLFPLSVTFGLMALVTVTAGVLAIRYDALFTALLGLLGGFATPPLLSTGVDNPVGLFSYTLLLNVGLLFVATRRRWAVLVPLGLLGTLIIEVGWFASFMSPEKMGIGLLAFLVFGLLYVLVPSLFEDQADARLGGSAVLGGLVPFAFALLLAGGSGYAMRWPLLFGYVALLDAALAAIALRRSGRVGLLLAASAATALMLPIWAASGLGRERTLGTEPRCDRAHRAAQPPPAPGPPPAFERRTTAWARRSKASGSWRTSVCCSSRSSWWSGVSASRPGRSWSCCWRSSLSSSSAPASGGCPRFSWRGRSRCPSSCRCGSSATTGVPPRWCAT